MKNQKGVTLLSLTIYVIALTIIIAMLSVISTYFYKNVNDTQDDITPLTEFTNFNSFFTTDVNTTHIKYLTNGSDDGYSYIALVNEDTSEVIKYVYVEQDNSIYRDTGSKEDGSIVMIPVARNVTNCKFEKDELTQTNKTKFKITLEVGNTKEEYNYSLNNE